MRTHWLMQLFSLCCRLASSSTSFIGTTDSLGWWVSNPLSALADQPSLSTTSEGQQLATAIWYSTAEIGAPCHCAFIWSCGGESPLSCPKHPMSPVAGPGDVSLQAAHWYHLSLLSHSSNYVTKSPVYDQNYILFWGVGLIL